LNLMRQLWVHWTWDLRQGLRRLMGRKFTFAEYRFEKEEFAERLRDQGLEILETVDDDFMPPKNIGLFTDFPSLQDGSRKWELNARGRFIESVLRRVSIGLYAAGTLYVCRVRK
jgi:hypothetical protein